VESGDVVFAAARGDYLPALRSQLGELAEEVQLTDTNAWYPHPSRRLRAFYELVVTELREGARGFRLAGEPVWPAGPPGLAREWQRYESVLNAVLAPFPVSLLCLYDGPRLEPSILDGAWCTHRRVRGPGREEESGRFEEPVDLLPRWNPRPPGPPASASGLWVA